MKAAPSTSERSAPPRAARRFRRYEALLRAERLQLQRMLDAWPAAEPAGPETRELGGAAAELLRRWESATLRSYVAQRLAEVDGALRRIYQGTYGRCKACGMLIPPARLEAVPTARLRVECQERLEREPASPLRPGC